ncbi:hypothetical protein [Wolbachia endosymbiont (group B) of Tholera decimalis]
MFLICSISNGIWYKFLGARNDYSLKRILATEKNEDIFIRKKRGKNREN